jgi:hypothetical protein
MQRQDYTGPVRWVIVDDGPEPMPTPQVGNWQVVHIRPAPLWAGENTQGRNIIEGLKLVDDRVAIIEDDDYYAPHYLTTVMDRLDRHDLVGEMDSHYYHVPTKTGKIYRANGHASLCATALKGNTVNALRAVCKKQCPIDFRLWAAHRGALYPWRGLVVGIKGLPGRPGIGVGHRRIGEPVNLSDWIQDPCALAAYGIT